MSDIDNDYWENLKNNHEDANDSLASLIMAVEMYAKMHKATIEHITETTERLKKERKVIVSEATKCFSDVMGRIDEHRLPDEHIFDTAMRIIDFYAAANPPENKDNE